MAVASYEKELFNTFNGARSIFFLGLESWLSCEEY